MTQHRTPPPPDDAPSSEGPAVGQDEWVARYGERRTVRAGRLGVLHERVQAAPWWAWLTLFVAIIGLLPLGF